MKKIAHLESGVKILSGFHWCMGMDIGTTLREGQ